MAKRFIIMGGTLTDQVHQINLELGRIEEEGGPVTPTRVTGSSPVSTSSILFATAGDMILGTSSTKVVSPCALATNAAIATNGYYTFAGGVIDQWGYVSTVPTNSSATITFPTSFASQVYAINAQGIYSNTTPQSPWTVGKVTTGGFTIYNCDGTVAMPYYWQAKGK